MQPSHSHFRKLQMYVALVLSEFLRMANSYIIDNSFGIYINYQMSTDAKFTEAINIFVELSIAT